MSASGYVLIPLGILFILVGVSTGLGTWTRVCNWPHAGATVTATRRRTTVNNRYTIVAYRFADSTGQLRDGTDRDYDRNLYVGNTIRVRHHPDEPHRNEIVGNDISIMLLGLVYFPALGVAAILGSLFFLE